jgi:hypothetical protein
MYFLIRPSKRLSEPGKCVDRRRSIFLRHTVAPNQFGPGALRISKRILCWLIVQYLDKRPAW